MDYIVHKPIVSKKQGKSRKAPAVVQLIAVKPEEQDHLDPSDSTDNPLNDSEMILDSSDLDPQSLDDASSVHFEDEPFTTFEPVEETDSGDVAPKFIDGQAVQLEDGTTAYIHATPREGLQAVQLEDGTVAYLSQTVTGMFNDDAAIEDAAIEMDQLENNTQESDTEDKEYRPKRQNRRKVQDKFQCEYPNCLRLYTTFHHLKVHERAHTGDRPFKCHINGCGKAFATGYGLKSHTRTHTGETPYRCGEGSCTKAFKTSGDLQKHVRTHTGERPFKCMFERCNRAFTTSNIRKVHMRTHTGEKPYLCRQEGCGRAFASATNYKNHTRIHSGEKPYICTISGCNKRFTEYSSLYKHHVVHTHTKPYTCSLCNKSYRQNSTLSLHRKNVHGLTEVEPATEKPVIECKVLKRSIDEEDEIDDSVEPVVIRRTSLHKEPSDTNVSDSKTYPTIVTLQSSSSSQILQEHPVYAVQVQEDGTLSTTMQQILLVTDPAQLAALQQLAQQGQFDSVLAATTAVQAVVSQESEKNKHEFIHCKMEEEEILS